MVIVKSSSITLIHLGVISSDLIHINWVSPSSSTVSTVGRTTQTRRSWDLRKPDLRRDGVVASTRAPRDPGPTMPGHRERATVSLSTITLIQSVHVPVAQCNVKACLTGYYIQVQIKNYATAFRVSILGGILQYAQGYSY